jgi:hypothetical protein
MKFPFYDDITMCVVFRHNIYIFIYLLQYDVQNANSKMM